MKHCAILHQVALLRIFHFWLHLSGPRETFFAVSSFIAYNQQTVKLFLSLCMYNLMSVRDFWYPLQNLQNLLDIQFGGWMYQSFYPCHIQHSSSSNLPFRYFRWARQQNWNCWKVCSLQSVALWCYEKSRINSQGSNIPRNGGKVWLCSRSSWKENTYICCLAF